MTSTATLPRLLLLLLLLCLASAELAADGLGSDEHVLVIGRVSDNPSAHYDRLKPLLDYVVERMSDLGIREGRILMARDGQAMASYLRQGRVDWITETAGAALNMIDRGQARLLALSQRGGLDRYHSIFLVRRDSGLTELADLMGHSVGFQHPMSTSAYLVPAGMLLHKDLPLAVLLSPLDRPSRDFVGYAFTGTESNSVAWVHKRLVDVGAISNQDWDELVVPVEDYARDLKIIARSPEYPRALELVRGDLRPEVAERLLEILLAAGDDPTAARAMAAYFNTERFSAITDEVLNQLEQLRPLVGRVRLELE